MQAQRILCGRLRKQLESDDGSRLNFGVAGTEIALSESSVTEELNAGHPIICSMKQGDFTTDGHFIVLTGMADGKIQVHDPNSKERSSRTWDYATLEPQIENLWSFTKL